MYDVGRVGITFPLELVAVPSTVNSDMNSDLAGEKERGASPSQGIGQSHTQYQIFIILTLLLNY